MQRKRRCAFDSDSLEEYIQLATIGQNQTNLFYDDKKIQWVQGRKQSEDDNEVQKEIEGFEHGCSPQIDYIDTSELPPDITLKSNDEIYTHHIMILGDVNQYVKQSLSMFCMQSRKNSNEDFNQELISPIKSKLCLDLAIKRIQNQNGVHIVKFLMHDMSVSNFAPIINVYFMNTNNYILVLNTDSSDLKEEETINYVKQRATKLTNIYVMYFSEQDTQMQRVPNKYQCNRWNISLILSQVHNINKQEIIEQVINHQ